MIGFGALVVYSAKLMRSADCPEISTHVFGDEFSMTITNSQTHAVAVEIALWHDQWHGLFSEQCAQFVAILPAKSSSVRSGSFRSLMCIPNRIKFDALSGHWLLREMRPRSRNAKLDL